jgi:hypothetical protein
MVLLCEMKFRVPLGSLFAYLGSVLIYDFDHSTRKTLRNIRKFLRSAENILECKK